MDALVAHLAAHQFRSLFIERLGWDRAQGQLLIAIDGHEYRFETIAHKRGLAVMECQGDRYTMFNRRRLRLLQKQVLKHAHEHIVIYRCDDPRKQVWQWAVHLPDGRRLRHREHPFFSDSPPAALLQRLAQLRFTLQEEERVTLVDALARVRAALDTEAELNLFVNKPWYAEQSDRLAIAMQGGDERAFREFVQFHLPMAAWGAKRWKRYMGGLDDEDAIQIAAIGLIEGARRFDRSRGTQFSTYAYHWIRQACQRYGPVCSQFIRFPPHVLPGCRAVHGHVQRLLVERGSDAVLSYLAHMACESPTLYDRYRRYALATAIQSLSDARDPGWIQARLIVDQEPSPLQTIEREAMQPAIEAAFSVLSKQDAKVIRLRYGFDGDPQTLEQIAQECGLTRERIRQRLEQAEERLRSGLRNLAFDGATCVTSGAPPRPAAGADDGGVACACKAVLSIVAMSKSGIRAVELASRCGLQRADRKSAIRSLLSEGSIVQMGRGRRAVYRPAQSTFDHQSVHNGQAAYAR